jgi:hypothetical protein
MPSIRAATRRFLRSTNGPVLRPLAALTTRPSSSASATGGALALLAAALSLSACSSNGGPPTSPDGGQICSQPAECGVGRTCNADHICVPLPCGGLCTPTQACTDSGTCVAAQGAICPTAGCPTGYLCNSKGVCGKQCTRDTECTPLVCDTNTTTCVQCKFDDTQDPACNSVSGSPWCYLGTCRACRPGKSDCGDDSYCDTATFACIPGCLVNGDCNVGGGEHCEGAVGTTPGHCVQCTVSATVTSTDPGCNILLPACDPTGRCVQCTADRFCSLSLPRCNVASPSSSPLAYQCVQCQPANDASGADCGMLLSSTGTARDPHAAMVCDPTQLKCTTGCRTDVQCGCPIDPGTSQERDCPRHWVQERCDPTLTTMNVGGTSTPSEGGCVECTSNLHCRCKVEGVSVTTTPACAGWSHLGSLNGARCTKDTHGYGVCTEGCDSTADCPPGEVCSQTGATKNKCVQCSCPGGVSADGTWCDDPAPDPNGAGCPAVSSGATAYYKVCDTTTYMCRRKRQSEMCSASLECGDPNDPTIGACIPPAPPTGQFCVLSAHPYSGSPEWYCDAGKATGRCGIACDDPQTNMCISSPPTPCPGAGSSNPLGATICKQATAVDTPPGGAQGTGKYCVSTKCNTP